MSNAIEITKSTMDNSLRVVILSVIGANSLIGGDSEFLFSFINTIQIMYMFPLLNLNLPAHYSSFLNGLAASNINIMKLLNIKVTEEY